MPVRRSGEHNVFLGVRARPGTVVRRRIPVATWPDGTDLYLPITIARGPRPGPVLYVQAGLHGDELIGVEVARQVASRVGVSRLRGTLVTVSIANPPAFLSRQRGWPFEARGPMDMNRLFPGRPDGPLTARIAHALFSGVLPSADYGIDFHGGMTGSSEAPFAQVVMLDDPHKTLAPRLAMAEAFGTELIYEMHLKERARHAVFRELEHSFAEQARLAGVPTLVVEMGEGGRISADLVELGIEGVRNVMRALDMLEGEPSAPAERFRFDRVSILRPNRAGVLQMRKRPGDCVEKEETVGEVADGLRVVERLRSPASGVVLRVATAAVTEPGADSLWVAERRGAGRNPAG